MGTGPAGRVNFTVWVVTRRSEYYYETPYVHLLQNWPLFARDPLECFQKRAFSETRFLLGFSVSGFPRMRADLVVGATCRRGDALYAELSKWHLYAGLSSRTSA